MVRSKDAGWTVEAHRDLDDLRQCWLTHFEMGLSGVMHVGFSRPETENFEAALTHNPPSLLLTHSALLALGEDGVTSTAPMEDAGGIKYFRVISGWGYERPIASSPTPVVSRRHVDAGHLFFEDYAAKSDWLEAMKSEDPAVAAAANAAGIANEADYLALEAVLPADLRRALGDARYSYYTGVHPDAHSVIENLRFSPPWLLQMNLEDLHLPVRAQNALLGAGYSTVADLLNLCGSEGGGIANLGMKSRWHIADELLIVFRRGPKEIALFGHREETQPGRNLVLPRTSPPTRRLSKTTKPESILPPSVDSFKGLLDHSLNLVKSTHRAALELRMGLMGRKCTLEDVGKKLGVTRERIRQIEKKAIQKLAELPFWRTVFEDKLLHALENRTSPLPVVGLDIVEPWFGGIQGLIEPFRFSVKHFCGGRFAVISVEEQLFISTIGPSEWASAVAKARGLVESGAMNGRTEEELRSTCDAVLLDRGREFREMLWDIATRKAHFARDPSRPDIRTLVGHGVSVDHIVHAVLHESDSPLHVSDIFQRCSARTARDLDIRTVHNSTANVGILLGRGTYGLRKHIPLDEAEASEVVAEAEQILAEGDVGRQWHAREILLALRDRDLDQEGALNSHSLTALLRASSSLVYLNRQVWSAKQSGYVGSSARIDLIQAAMSVLDRHGRPMSTAEIRAKLSEERGVSAHFQLHPGGGLVRVGAGRWGLFERDVPLTSDSVEMIVTALRLALEVRDRGIHASEIPRVLKEWGIAEKDAGLDPTVYLDLAKSDERMALGRGQFLFLSEWGEPRRLTVLQAARRVFEESSGTALSLDQVEARVEELIDRPLPMFVSACFREIGAVFSTETQLWTYDPGATVDDDEFM